MTAPRIVGVVGAGTMGAGIAQLAAQSGLETVLHDPVPEALERGVTRIEASWRKRPVEGARERLRPVGALEELEACDLIIEAAPERLELKGELLRELAAHTEAVLATNTSSLPVTAVGAASGAPGRVVGMHFFNPPPVMRLVEVVAGVDTSPESVAVARAAAEAMGRRVVEVADGIGFLVNRCNRPFSLEALRIVHEGLATPRAGRPHLPAGRRLPHGAVRAHGSRRRRRRPGDRALVLRAELPRAALAPVAAAAPDGRRRPPRPQGGPRLVRVPRRAARAARGAERARARRGRRARRHRGRAAGRDRAGAARAGRGLARRGARRRGRGGAVHRDRRRRRRVRAAAGRAADAPVRGGHARRAGARRVRPSASRPSRPCVPAASSSSPEAPARPRRPWRRRSASPGRSGCTSRGWATRRGSSSRGSWRRS